MIKVGIIDGDGYAAGELIRILLNHPDIKLSWVNSRNNAGKKVADVHAGLIGEREIVFTSETPFADADMLFLCMPDGESHRFLETHDVPADMKIVDLSKDHRADDAGGYIYGMSEINRKYIIRGTHVANPGSIATAVLLALLPLAKNLLLNSDIHATAIIGSTEMESRVSQATHYSWRNDNAALYNPLCHEQTEEIVRTLHSLQSSFCSGVNLIPVLGSFSRGILASVYLDCPVELKEVEKLYEDYYDDHRFTYLSDRMPSLKDVVNTNKCVLHLEKHNGKLLIVSVIDNLLKGSAGQAVHNMNLLFGLHERTGLDLKASAF